MQETKQKSLEKSTDFLINERVRVFCKMMNLIPADIERLGINKSTVSKVFANEQGVTLNFVHKLKLKFSNLNFDWLILGEGNMFMNAGPKVYSENEKLNVANDPEPCRDCVALREKVKLLEKINLLQEEKIARFDDVGEKREVSTQNSAQAG